jgi:flagellar biosynthesis/type III secretory pathway chaperone
MSTLVNCNVKITEIIYILKNEARVLSKGRLEGLEEIVLQKTTSLAELERLISNLKNQEDVNRVAPQIDKMRRLANENGVILKSVMNGLRSARERLQALQHLESNVGAYDREGSTLYLNGSHTRAEKKV